jgi:hypothetical protein
MFGWYWQQSEQQVYVTMDRIRPFKQLSCYETNLDRLYAMCPCFLPLFSKDNKWSPILKKSTKILEMKYSIHLIRSVYRWRRVH